MHEFEGTGDHRCRRCRRYSSLHRPIRVEVGGADAQAPALPVLGGDRLRLRFTFGCGLIPTSSAPEHANVPRLSANTRNRRR